jgi:hypothetical protein
VTLQKSISGVACSITKLLDSLFFIEATVYATTYLDMLEIYYFLPLEEQGVEIFQHDSAPPFYRNIVHDKLDTRFPDW